MAEKAFWFYLFRIFPIKKNKIVVSNFGGRGFGDNPKYIALSLLAQEKNYDIVWLSRDMNAAEFPSKIRLVKENSLRAIYEQVTARVWVDNCRKPFYVRKRAAQFYVQTWHGDLGVKMVEKDAEQDLNEGYLRNAKNDAKMTDLMIAGSKWTAALYKKSFWYEGEVLLCGSPKSEILLHRDEKIISRVKNALGIESDFRIVMFAPTFRNTDLEKQFDFDYEKILKAIKNRFGENWTFVRRFHPNVADIAHKNNAQVIDATNYPDMQELLMATDILITDYSSTSFETMYSDKKNCFLYADDLALYDRGFYFDLKELPFSLAENLEDLETNIAEFDEKDYSKKVMDFKNKLGFLENPCGAKTCAERIREVVFDGEGK